jgi:CBS domain containing-hemolysin-like protein
MVMNRGMSTATPDTSRLRIRLTSLGMTFLEDAIEEIVGPIHDELNVKQERIAKVPPNTVSMAGSVPLPEAASVLGIEFDEEADTVGGWVVAKLGRFLHEGDFVDIAEYRATAENLEGHRVGLVRFEKDPLDNDKPADGPTVPHT